MAKSSTTDSASKKSGPKMGSGCLILFAIPFAGIGVFMLGLIARDLWIYRSAQSWEPTPATLLAAELKLGGDDGSTYCATARYQYEYGGKTYVGNRVALYQRSDNIGDFQWKHGNELVRKFEQGQPVTAYVNPADPSQAMLLRQLRPEVIAFHSIFVLVFGGAGFGLLAGGIEGEKILRREKALRRKYPDEPWRWKDEWLDGRLRPIDFAWIALIGAFFWNIIAWPMCIAAAFDESSRILLLITAAFVLAGLWLAGWAGRLWIQRWKWGIP